MKHWVVVDTNNQFLDKNFKVEGDVVTKITPYSSHQILGRDPFPLTGRHYYSLYVENISYSIFSMGIASQNRRNYQVSHESVDCMSYFAKTGMIWRRGLSIGGGPIIPNKVEIRVVVDFIKQTIKWFMDGVEIGSALI